jgi:hypothetical protein
MHDARGVRVVTASRGYAINEVPVLKAILFAALAACGVPSTPATVDPPDDFKPAEPDVKPIDSHWCCQSVDPKTKSGEGCNMISSTIEVVDACAQYLNCSGGATKQDGKVTCL